MDDLLKHAQLFGLERFCSKLCASSLKAIMEVSNHGIKSEVKPSNSYPSEAHEPNRHFQKVV
eukprot:scaffold12862_cov102-Cyclotella_meneghiniana.AAC.3